MTLQNYLRRVLACTICTFSLFHPCPFWPHFGSHLGSNWEAGFPTILTFGLPGRVSGSSWCALAPPLDISCPPWALQIVRRRFWRALGPLLDMSSGPYIYKWAPGSQSFEKPGHVSSGPYIYITKHRARED